MNARPTSAMRVRFFSDGTGTARPFANGGWRGCVLDRDNYTNTRLPAILWRALVQAATTLTVKICGYSATGERCSTVGADWKSYEEYLLSKKNYSPEYIIFDDTGRWAILADVDVTTLGLDAELADRVDSLLSKDHTSLLALTCKDFSIGDVMSPGGAYVRSVLGDTAVQQLKADGWNSGPHSPE